MLRLLWVLVTLEKRWLGVKVESTYHYEPKHLLSIPSAFICRDENVKIFFPGVGLPHCTDDQNRAVGDVYARNVEAGRMVFQAPEAEKIGISEDVEGYYHHAGSLPSVTREIILTKRNIKSQSIRAVEIGSCVNSM